MEQNRCYIEKISNNLSQQLDRSLKWIDINNKISRDKVVFLKPNLTYPRFNPGVTTTPHLLEALIVTLLERGCRIIVGESDGGYNAFDIKDTFNDFGLYEFEKKYGIKVVNLSVLPYEFLIIHKFGRDFKVEIPKILLHDIDAFITIPVPKVHSLTQISLSYKNQWGCVPNNMRLRYHPVFNEAIYAINQAIKNKFAIIDGTYGLTRTGPMLGDAFALGLFLASNSLETADLIMAKIMKVDLKEIKHYVFPFKKGLVSKEADIKFNQDYQPFISDRFYLEREIWNYIALLAWLHPSINYFLYESIFSGLLHKIMYAFRKKTIDKNL